MFITSILSPRLRLVGMLVGLGIATTACTDGYGYYGVELGYSDPYYGGGYGDYYGGGFGNAGYVYGGYGYGGFGWYGDYYYPGTGVYVYDRARRPHRWNDSQRGYWEGRRGDYRGDRRGNWGGFADRGVRDGRSGYVAGRPDAPQGFRGDRGPRSDGQAFRGGDDGRGFGNRQRSAGGDGIRGGGNPGGRGFGGGRGGGGSGRRGR